MSVSAPAPESRLFTPLFFVMCGFSFTVFLSAFILLPTAPFRILELGGSDFAAGMFLGLLTYSSAFAAPFTGALADRFGRRRVLISCSLALSVFAAAYAVVPGVVPLLVLVPFHGAFWSGLMAASAAFVSDILPAHRRAEGLGLWGLSTIAAISMAPSFGFALKGLGWPAVCIACGALNLLMAAIATRLREPRRVPAPGGARRWSPGGYVANEAPSPPSPRHDHRFGAERGKGSVVEWRIVFLSLTLFLYSFGYGGITSFSAVDAQRAGIEPKSLFFTVFAGAMLFSRVLIGRQTDALGHRRVLIPCLVAIAAGLALMVPAPTRNGVILAAVVFGTGFGAAYPAFAALVLQNVPPERRGAAFGSILAAFDTGIGTGSVAIGFMAQRIGFRGAWAVAAALALLALPYFLWAEKRTLAVTSR
ncbi:MAG: MFS transporter [Vicinamibacteria bacterium]|nr:MFS transporter [Vicinamibacteria bacterium]